ncbi:MAG TPA: Flp family type IVb pilin [Actinomycetota bacterium]
MDRRARWADESVSTEYGLILFFIAAVIIGAVIAFGVILVSLFEQAPPALDP